MLFETESPGDTIAAPICLTNDREDALSRNRVDSHSDQADAEPTAVLLEDWRDTVIKPAAGCLAPSSQRQLPRAGSIPILHQPILLAGAHASTRLLRSLPSCGLECAVSARSAASARPGGRSTTGR
jgi:hypothetical protein